MKLSLNRNQIKYIVAAAMLIDHCAWLFVPTATLRGQILHFIGRLTGATMAFFLAEGYVHTRDLKGYALRMGVFALLSWPPFSLMETGRWPTAHLSVIYTLFLGLIAICVWDRLRAPGWAKLLLTVALCLLSAWGDWAYADVLWPLIFFAYRDRPRAKWIGFSLVAAVMVLQTWDMFRGRPYGWAWLFQTGIFLVPLLLHFYNGEGGSRHPFHKWFFYVFYPAHMLVLALVVFHMRGVF